MTAPEADWQLVTMPAATHKQSPVGTVLSDPNRRVADRIPVEKPGDYLADRFVLRPERTAECASECGRVTGPHSTQVVGPAEPADKPLAGGPRVDFLLQLDAAGWAWPAGRRGDLDREARRIDQLEVITVGEHESPVHALIDGRAEPKTRVKQGSVNPEHPVKVGRTKNHGAKVHVGSP